MTTGRTPFPGEHPQSVIRAVLNDRPVPMTGLRAGVPAELDRITVKALAKRADHRYSDVDELISDLRNLKGLVESSQATAAVVASSRPRRRYGAIAIALVALTAALFALWRGLPRGGGEVIGSIAVLPLENLTGDPDQLYFVDGMQEALITNLSRIGSLRVISRTSAMRYRETRPPMPEIAPELGVDVLV